ncbi:hypothetical protein CVD19_01030 [Bacillus sp. T33-2]|nr:hypothetical protein CVD19_01030 [Bacillus sp. T33-2]
MVPLKESVRQALDKSFYNDLDLNEIAKKTFINQIVSGGMRQNKRKRSWPRFSIGFASIGVLLIALLLSMPMLQQFTNKTAAIQKEVSEKFGHEVVIPEFEEYPMTFAAITDIKEVGHRDLSITYAKNKGGLDPRMDDPETVQKWENQNESKLFYGPYLGRQVLNVRYSKGNAEVDDAKIKKLNGFDVQYSVLSRPAGNFYLATINVKNGNYNLESTLGKDFTEQDAEKLIKEFTQQLLNKGLE